MCWFCGLRHGERDHPGLFAQGDLRLSGNGGGKRVHLLHQPERVGVGHHMFTIGMTSVGNAFFTLSTMVISVPTGIKIFNWLATLWGGKIRFQSPMLFALPSSFSS